MEEETERGCRQREETGEIGVRKKTSQNPSARQLNGVSGRGADREWNSKGKRTASGSTTLILPFQADTVVGPVMMGLAVEE